MPDSILMLCEQLKITHMSCGHNEYWVVDAEPNGCMPPPGRGKGSDPELLDSPIGLFHYPSPGALLRLLGHFIFI